MSIWIQISSGRGPAECAWVVAQLASTLETFVRSKGLEISRIEENAGEQSETFDSIVFSLNADDEPDWLKEWIGTIQWIGESPFRAKHRRKNWFVGLQVIEQAKNTKFDIESKDLKFEAFRSSGSGGQNVNKVSTAVRLTHIPTGKSVVAQDERSQFQNKRIALERLKRLFQIDNESSNLKVKQKRWQQHNDLQRGNPIQTYSGRKFEKVK
ncbi:MAG: peptide chain release factor H [Candidatus Obscuribacterales bacterium]|nr:peptide chain release factor H [Candidatus Obscuribacterales bacterium]